VEEMVAAYRQGVG